LAFRFLGGGGAIVEGSLLPRLLKAESVSCQQTNGCNRADFVLRGESSQMMDMLALALGLVVIGAGLGCIWIGSKGEEGRWFREAIFVGLILILILIGLMLALNVRA